MGIINCLCQDHRIWETFRLCRWDEHRLQPEPRKPIIERVFLQRSLEMLLASTPSRLKDEHTVLAREV